MPPPMFPPPTDPFTTMPDPSTVPALLRRRRRGSKLPPERLRQRADTATIIPSPLHIPHGVIQPFSEPKIEARRPLCDSYNLFFTDRRILPLLPRLLASIPLCQSSPRASSPKPHAFAIGSHDCHSKLHIACMRHFRRRPCWMTSRTSPPLLSQNPSSPMFSSSHEPEENPDECLCAVLDGSSVPDSCPSPLPSPPVRPLGREAHNERAWAHWRRIGEPKLIVAPMVDNFELPFRMLCRKYGVEAAYTSMLHSRIFSENEKYGAGSSLPVRKIAHYLSNFAQMIPAFYWKRQKW